VDYFSKFPLVLKLEDKAASTVCSLLRSLFVLFGVPLTLFADNMPFASQYMQKFAGEWDFEVITSSPGFPQSNGQAERAIKTVKALFKKSEQTGTDPAVALMNYAATPLTGSSKSPAELFYNQQVRTKMPVVVSKLIPERAADNRQQLVHRQERQKEIFDRTARDLPPLKPGDVVRVRQDSELTRGVVTAAHNSPRSYIVETERGSTLRRNRRHLIPTTEARPDTRPRHDEQPTPASSHERSDSPPLRQTVENNSQKGILKQTVTSSGQSVKPPVRFSDYLLN
jgi:hypothetical protein